MLPIAIVFLAAANLSWITPIENVDGSQLILCADRTQQQIDDDFDCLDKFRIYWGTTSRDYTDQVELDDETLTGHTVEPAISGVYHFAMTAVDLEGNESAFSNEVIKSLIEPGPPVIIAQEEAVFTVIKQPNSFILLPIGTVPAGTTCDPSNSVNGLGAVPTDDVIWTSPTGSRPIVVVARCDG